MKSARDTSLPGEIRLMAAVIARAERDAHNGDKLAKRWLREVRRDVKNRQKNTER